MSMVQQTPFLLSDVSKYLEQLPAVKNAIWGFYLYHIKFYYGNCDFSNPKYSLENICMIDIMLDIIHWNVIPSIPS